MGVCVLGYISLSKLIIDLIQNNVIGQRDTLQFVMGESIFY